MARPEPVRLIVDSAVKDQFGQLVEQVEKALRDSSQPKEISDGLQRLGRQVDDMAERSEREMGELRHLVGKLAEQQATVLRRLDALDTFHQEVRLEALAAHEKTLEHLAATATPWMGGLLESVRGLLDDSVGRLLGRWLQKVDDGLAETRHAQNAMAEELHDVRQNVEAQGVQLRGLEQRMKSTFWDRIFGEEEGT